MPTLDSMLLPSQATVRLATALLSATAITFLLFAAMQQLIKADSIERAKAVPYNPVQLYAVPKESDPKIRQQLPEPPKPQPRDIPKPELLSDDSAQLNPGTIGLAPVELPANAGPGKSWTQVDRGATPLVRVEPRYPIEAARDGISGWVQLSFTIDKSGAVTEVRVVSAQPANLFNREAIRALKRWKYQPKIVDGAAVSQPNMQVQLDFSLQAD